MHKGMPYCARCATQLKEYLGLGRAPGDGEWYCPSCDGGGAIPEPIDPEETPPLGILPFTPSRESYGHDVWLDFGNYDGDDDE